MELWRRVDDGSDVSKVSYRTIVTKKFVMPNGEVGEFGTTAPEGQRLAAVVAVTALGKVIVARQFRVGPEKIFDELPGGFVDANEEPIDAAGRELVEETGYTSPHPLVLLGVVNQNAYTNATNYYYLAEDCVKTEKPKLDDEEHVEVAEIDFEDAVANASNNRMSDPVGILLAERYRRLRDETAN